MSKEQITREYQKAFIEAHLRLSEVEILYKREYKKDLPFDNWLNGVISDAFSRGVQYSVDRIKNR